MDESIVSAFSKDLNSAKTGRKAIVDAKYQRYKTITESFIYDEVEDKGLIENTQMPNILLFMLKFLNQS